MPTPKVRFLVCLALLALVPFVGSGAEPQVVDVYRGNPSCLNCKRYEIGLNDNLIVIVENLKDWPDALVKNPKIIPYINGIAIKGNYPIGVEPKNNKITFVLKRHQDATNDNRDAWAMLLRRPDITDHTRPVEVSVGTEDGKSVLPIKSSEKLELIVLPHWWWVLGLLLVVIAVALVYLAITSNILRDSDLEPFHEGDRKPYSLARTQMAVWFVLILGCYTVIFAVTTDLGTIPGTVLGLMGISAVTAVAAVSLDTSRQAERRKALSEERKQLDDKLTALQTRLATATPAEKPTLEAELADTKTKLEELNPKSRGFFLDILSDDDGVSFPRFQMAAWTLVLAIVFLATVYNTLAMPAFDGLLLGLMGLSSGTYLGFKAPVKK